MSYESIISEFGDILIQDDDGEYSGDSIFIIKKDDRYGSLYLGWGSCSYCDAYQACESEEDFKNLTEDLRTDVEWHDSLDDLIKSLEIKTETPNKWWLNEKRLQDIISQCKRYADENN